MKVFRRIFSRVVLFSLGIFIQLLWLFFVIFKLSDYYLPIAFALNFISLIAVLYILYRPGNPLIKMAWIVPILVFPLFGGIIFMISGGKGPKRKLSRGLCRSQTLLEPYLPKTGLLHHSQDEVRPQDKYIEGQCRYLVQSGFPCYENTDAEYFDNGRDGWIRMLEDLKRAERFIFLEYFIVKPGFMWDTVLEILKEKANAGVEIRMIYDDVGSITYLPRKYACEMEALGIKCMTFNPYRPVYSVVMNHRDHRKILVIDGHTAYTGGINFADEYIGEDLRLGEWKDNVLRLRGEGVRSMSLMFLHMWNAIRPSDTTEDIRAYMPRHEDVSEVICKGVVQPYGDSPVDSEPVAENVYLNIINQAVDYVYIFSPYVIIDTETNHALCLAAKRGVDVRLVVPAVPDKKIVYHLTQSYFPELIENGVKIYKFTPGFVHSKCFVADDRLAVVGSINTDYRSLYLHFENACYFVDHPVVAEVKKDFESTFPRCEMVALKERRFTLLHKAYLSVLRLFAPLL
ncbi:MAG: cardiolipin synthase [Clostridia bacterium]|nr:cardiolipin synthase [Clostridia bacterium]